MITIPIKVCGDFWRNPDFVTKRLSKLSADDSVELDFIYEGPCIKRLGLLDILKNSPTQNITLHRWSNLSRTPAPYPNTYRGPVSHFFKMAENYWINDLSETQPNAYRFAFFHGRDTIARNSILYDVVHEYPALFLLSKLQQTIYTNPWKWISADKFVNCELDDVWTDGQHISEWLSAHPIPSLDNRQQFDQYNLGVEVTAKSLLTHYNRFHIELVCETYTLGDTFFVTEKTVRPIMAAKPVLVYGPRHFLKNLQAIGFETYSSCWDESYDELEGWARWQAIKQQLPNIAPSAESQDIANRNRQHLHKLIQGFDFLQPPSV